jgi:hypothetical protein
LIHRKSVYQFAGPPRQLDHFIRARRGSADAQASIAARHQLPRDGVKDRVKDVVADALRTGQLDQRQRKPFAHDGQMSRAKHLQRYLGHGTHIGSNQGRIVVGAGSIWPGDKNHHE